MHRKDIQSIINADEEFEFGGVVASSSANNAENNSRPSWNVTRPWCDRDEACDNSGAEADRGPFPFESVVKDTPGNASDRSSQVGDDRGHDRAQIRTQCRTSIESEPSNPEEDGADNDVGDIVRPEVEFMGAVSASLAEHQGIGQSSRTRGDVHRGSTSEI